MTITVEANAHSRHSFIGLLHNHDSLTRASGGSKTSRNYALYVSTLACQQSCIRPLHTHSSYAFLAREHRPGGPAFGNSLRLQCVLLRRRLCARARSIFVRGDEHLVKVLKPAFQWQLRR